MNNGAIMMWILYISAAILGGALAHTVIDHQKECNNDSDASLCRPAQSMSELPNPSGKCSFRQSLNFHSNNRRDRFPSVEERVCLYMTRWYDPLYGTDGQWEPVLDYNLVNETSIEILYENQVALSMDTSGDLLNDVPFFLFQQNMTLLKNWANQTHWILFFIYAKDTEAIMEPFQRKQQHHPILFVWGDQEMKIPFSNLPFFGKWRFNNIDDHTTNVPIIVKLESYRHFLPIKQVRDKDMSWEEKKDAAVWRGAMTGIVEGKFYYDHDYEENPVEVCLMYERCRLVYRYGSNQTRVNAGFTEQERYKGDLGFVTWKDRVSVEEQLGYKMLISLQGNDVASGLKWNLYSNSVVLMPPPTKSIYSMEVLLEPWIHYVPIDIDDLDAAIDWVLQHQDEAQQISRRAKTFIEDLFFHPDAEAENDQVMDQIAQRYSALWSDPQEEGIEL